MSSLPEAKQHAFLATLTSAEAEALCYDWEFWARPEQLPSLDAWRVWLILAGRGWGKTRTGAEWVRQQVKHYKLVNMIGATTDDARDIMIEGESGILAICPPGERPEYRVTKRRLDWPNGARSLIFTADEPERLRGKQHMKLWADELAAWRYQESWDQAMMGLRLGDNPQVVVTTTPRPIATIKELLALNTTVTVHGTTYNNRSNLAPQFYNDIIRKYEGTRMGRQELNAEILDDNPGALWKREWIDAARTNDPPDLVRVVVAVDPSGSPRGDEIGITVQGSALIDSKWHFYLLEDVSLHGTPNEWGSAVVAAYHKWKADAVVAEGNFGGDMVTNTINTVSGGRNVKVKLVHASRGKAVRAEPISAVYEQGRGHHVGSFPTLEDEMCQWEPGMQSPNRMDALVWGATELVLQKRGVFVG